MIIFFFASANINNRGRQIGYSKDADPFSKNDLRRRHESIFLFFMNQSSCSSNRTPDFSSDPISADSNPLANANR